MGNKTPGGDLADIAVNGTTKKLRLFPVFCFLF